MLFLGLFILEIEILLSFFMLLFLFFIMNLGQQLDIICKHNLCCWLILQTKLCIIVKIQPSQLEREKLQPCKIIRTSMVNENYTPLLSKNIYSKQVKKMSIWGDKVLKQSLALICLKYYYLLLEGSQFSVGILCLCTIWKGKERND